MAKLVELNGLGDIPARELEAEAPLHRIAVPLTDVLVHLVD